MIHLEGDSVKQDVAKGWETWGNGQHFTGNGAIPDYAHPEQLNRYTWYQTHDWKKPYPGDSKIYAPAGLRATLAVHVSPPGCSAAVAQVLPAPYARSPVDRTGAVRSLLSARGRSCESSG